MEEMNSYNRVHACLDGELPETELGRDERARLARLRLTNDAVAGVLRAAPVPDLAARVMAVLPERAPVAAATAPTAVPAHTPAEPWWRGLVAPLAWVWQPHSFTLRPAYGFAGLAVAAVTAFVVGQAVPEGFPAIAGSAAAPTAVQVAQTTPQVYVQFRLKAPNAEQVRLAGTFTGWEPRVVLRERAPGEWYALVPLEPGVHEYAFVVDGQRWVADPAAPQVPDQFGGENSRLTLPPPTSAV